MKAIKFFLFLVITMVLVYLLNNPLTIGETPLPAIGKLLSPSSGFWQNAEPSDTRFDTDVNLNKLKEGVAVYYDDRRVPHVFAKNVHDALMVQGYVTARDRLFQMDLSTRSAEGTLSEILGERTLGRDIWNRRKGMVFAAENAVKEWKKDEEAWTYLEAYADGINQYIDELGTGEIPLEYKLINATPQKWTPFRTAIFVKIMAASLAERHYDVQATNALAMFGRDTFDFLFPEYVNEESPIIPSTKRWDFPVTQVPDDSTDNDVIQIFDYSDYERAPEHYGSNNWAVAGSKTKSGNPILCGDPHLGLTLPSIWYEMQISCPEFNSYGVSLPGIPFVIIGFNENIAWSQTNVGHDVADLYKMKWKDETKQEYELDGNWKKTEFKIEEFNVKGKGIVKDTVPYTVWGPVLFEGKENLDADLAYRWLAHFGSDKNEIRTFLELNKASNFDEYNQALLNYNVPAQNYVFASRDGDIAMRVSGMFPLKEDEQGRFVRDGSKSNSGWKGFIPKDQVPMVKNPPSGYVQSANQRSTDDSYPYYYNREKFEAYRGRYLDRELKKSKDITVKDMIALQNSNYDLKAEESLPIFLSHLDSAMIYQNAKTIQMLEDWDFEYNADSYAGTFFDKWFANIWRNTWDEMMVQDAPTLTPTYWQTIRLMRDVPYSVFFDDRRTPEQEKINDIVTKSFKQTMDTYSDGVPTWNDHQQPAIWHLARIAPFNRPVSVGGVGSALNAQTPTAGPSWRQIVELNEDGIKAYVTYPGGQSGNPGSKHYDDFINYWETGQYYEALFMTNENSHERLMVSKQNFK